MTERRWRSPRRICSCPSGMSTVGNPKCEVRVPKFSQFDTGNSTFDIPPPVTLNWLTNRKSLFADCSQSITRNRSVSCPPRSRRGTAIMISRFRQLDFVIPTRKRPPELRFGDGLAVSAPVQAGDFAKALGTMRCILTTKGSMALGS